MTALQEASTKALDALRKAMQGNLDFDVALEAFEALCTALAQHREQQGWKWVPVEPTPEMLKAPPNAWEADAKITYAAMLAAAPAPQAQEPAKCNHCGGTGELEQFTSAGAPTTKMVCLFCKGDKSFPVFKDKNPELAWIEQCKRDEEPAPQPAQGEPTGCVCRWDADDNRVATCARHQGWLDVVHEWAERAKATDAALQSAQPEDGCAPNHMCNGHRVHIQTGECCNKCGATSW